jgi:hypothetical protein
VGRVADDPRSLGPARDRLLSCSSDEGWDDGPVIDPGLRGRVALVTGCNQPAGIGVAIARALAAQGVVVALVVAPPEAVSGGTATMAVGPPRCRAGPQRPG